jgi:hypothetical protein
VYVAVLITCIIDSFREWLSSRNYNRFSACLYRMTFTFKGSYNVVIVQLLVRIGSVA